MATAVQILAFLAALQPWRGDASETREARTARLDPWAQALEGYPLEVQAAVLTVGGYESHWAAYVTEGRCSDRPHMCDKGKARGPYQTWAWCKATDPQGLTDCAARLLVSMRNRCGSWERAFGGYASGGKCFPMPEREATRKRVQAMLLGGT